MAEIKIKIPKGANPSAVSSEQNNIAEQMEAKIIFFTREFFIASDCFDEAKVSSVYDAVYDYIETYDRILYAPITNEIYRYFDKQADKSGEEKGTLLTNLDKLVTYAFSEKPLERKKHSSKEEKRRIQDTKKAILKIRDHVNLAQQQYSVLRQSDDEYAEKFQKQFRKSREDITKEMNAQMLTMVGMFTALAFLVFGGISSLDNIFSVNGIPLLKIMIIASVWGLGILNLVFTFLFCVGKMTDLDFKSTKDQEADIFQKYPVVWWSDLLLISILALCSWVYLLWSSFFVTL